MKNKLIELIDGLREELTPNAYIKISNAVRSLPDDQPYLLPFQWPIPEGYEVVTRDGRKVVKIDFWEMLDMPVLFAVEEYSEPFTALPDGRTCLSRQSECDLFLRRVEKKVWVVDYNGVLDFYEDKKDAIDHNQTVYDGDAKVYQILVKPVV